MRQKKVQQVRFVSTIFLVKYSIPQADTYDARFDVVIEANDLGVTFYYEDKEKNNYTIFVPISQVKQILFQDVKTPEPIPQDTTVSLKKKYNK